MADIKFKTVFDFGDIVYVVTDANQFKGIITAISKSWNGGVEYEVSFDCLKNWYQAIELSKERDTQALTPPEINSKEEDDDE